MRKRGTAYSIPVIKIVEKRLILSLLSLINLAKMISMSIFANSDGCKVPKEPSENHRVAPFTSIPKKQDGHKHHYINSIQNPLKICNKFIVN